MMSLIARRELASAVAGRYQAANKAAKTLILDEFVQSSGLNRKYAISMLGAASAASPKPKVAGKSPRRRRRKYDVAVERLFLELWRVSGGMCPKRLVPFLPELIAALERFDEITIGSRDRELLLQM